jgi:putative colanic acid biosynthesis acetyltransferase WcaF
MIDMKMAFLRSHAYRLATHPGFERELVPSPSTAVFYAPDRPVSVSSSEGAVRGVGGGESSAPPAGEPDRSAVGEVGQLVPESSPWTFREKVRRAIWMLVGKPLFRASFHNWYGWRNWLLRRFGARIGNEVRIRPSVNIEIPWNLDIRDGVTVGDHAILYSLGMIVIGERTIVSQYAHVCAGTHDYTHHEFPLIRDPVVVGADAWIGADAFVGPSVTIGSLSVLGARSSVYKDMDPRMVYVGNPAKPIKERELR